MRLNRLLTILVFGFALNSQAKIWRVNNNGGIDRDFSSLYYAISSNSVVDGDTIYVEPSATTYSGAVSMNKRLVVVGVGYRLDSANGGNYGLQHSSHESILSTITLNSGSEGSKFIGVAAGGFQFRTIAAVTNIEIERCRIYGNAGIYIPSSWTKTVDSVTVRKCFFSNSGFNYVFENPNLTLQNFVMENCIFLGYARLLPGITSTNVVFRNNTLDYITARHAYVANNIFTQNTSSSFTACIVRNNIFVRNQGGVAVGPLSVNGNNLIGQSLSTICVNSGSDDGQFKLLTTSPAIGGGVSIGGIKPDCGAYGGADPYMLSGIPNIPTIYYKTLPNGNTIPSGTQTFIVDFNTRGNK